MHPVARAVERLARGMAIAGGLVLCALVVLTSLSVLGRGLDTLAHAELLEGAVPELAAALAGAGFGPVRGDFELVEAGVAFAIFAFLPICQLHGAHASVDVLTDHLPRGAQRAIVAFWEIVLAAAIVLITWRLIVGLQDKHRNGQTTFVLQFPLWWAYAASAAAALVAAVVALHCAVVRVVAVARRGEEGVSPSRGAPGGSR